MPRLLFPDPPSAADVLTFAGRAATLSDGAIRLRAQEGTLMLTAAALAPRTLLESTPTVLAMRAVRVDPELVCDLVVDAAQLTAADDPSAVQLPESAVAAPWAGVTPPRSGWELQGELPAARLAARAQWGIAAVADALPADAGEEIVHTVRSAVWGVPDDTLAGLPLGAAFAAFALGFIGGEETAVVRSSGAWCRLSLTRGHVLTRSRTHTGLTPVRATGGS